MRRENSSAKIIKALADGAPLTVYAIAKKSGVAVSFVHKVVKRPKEGLEPQRIVRVHSERTWRTGLERVEYILTFRGLMEYFILLFEERRAKATLEAKEAIEKYRQFYDYPIFAELECLEAWLGEKVYGFICSTAWIIKNHPPFMPIITEGVSGSLPAIIQSIVKGWPPISLQVEEKTLTYAFTLVFFDLATMALAGQKISSTPNPALYKLVDQTYKELSEAFKQRLMAVEKLEDALKKQFST
jgi:hypothetical protein